MLVKQYWNNKQSRFLFFLLVLSFIGSTEASTAEHPDFGKAVPIPDSIVASSGSKGIVAAMLPCATTRYAHAVLGDEVEAGCLVVIDESDQMLTIELPQSGVFENLEPLRLQSIRSK